MFFVERAICAEVWAHIRDFFEDVMVVIIEWPFHGYGEGRVNQAYSGLSIIDFSGPLSWIDLLMPEKRSEQLQ